MEREFTCENCGGVFTTEQPEHEVLAEAEIVFQQEIPKENRASVCDDCFKKIMEWYEKFGKHMPKE